MSDLIQKILATMDQRRAERMARLLMDEATKDHSANEFWHSRAEDAFQKSLEGRFDAAHRKLLEGHDGVHRCDWGEHRGGEFGPCGRALILAEAYGIEVES